MFADEHYLLGLIIGWCARDSLACQSGLDLFGLIGKWDCLIRSWLECRFVNCGSSYLGFADGRCALGLTRLGRLPLLAGCFGRFGFASLQIGRASCSEIV